jgi:chaperone required for assembly of F1-ATPase
MWNRYLMLALISAHIPWNALLNLELRRSYSALRNDLVLPSATTLSNICQREYALTVDAIKKQLPIRNKVNLALDGWTSTNKQAITSVIAYYMDGNWALCEVQLVFDEVNRLFCSRFES